MAIPMKCQHPSLPEVPARLPQSTLCAHLHQRRVRGHLTGVFLSRAGLRLSPLNRAVHLARSSAPGFTFFRSTGYRVCAHACMHACTCVYVRACMCVHMCACVSWVYTGARMKCDRDRVDKGREEKPEESCPGSCIKVNVVYEVYAFLPGRAGFHPAASWSLPNGS